jgi:predicted lactoylglutathione lyase
MIKAVKFVSIPVKDQGQALDFYTKKLGFQILTDQPRTYQELSARGVDFEQPPKKEQWGTSAIFKDLDGNVFLLSSK